MEKLWVNLGFGFFFFFFPPGVSFFSLLFSCVIASGCSCAQDVFWHAQSVESKMQTGGCLLILYFDCTLLSMNESKF